MTKSLNRATIIGYVGDEPTVRTFSNNMVANFSVVTNETARNSETGAFDEVAEWHRIVAWGRLAELAQKYIHKGTQVYLDGRIRSRSYTDKNGIKRYTTEILSDNIILLGSRRDRQGEMGYNAQGNTGDWRSANQGQGGFGAGANGYQSGGYPGGSNGFQGGGFQGGAQGGYSSGSPFGSPNQSGSPYGNMGSNQYGGGSMGGQGQDAEPAYQGGGYNNGGANSYGSPFGGNQETASESSPAPQYQPFGQPQGDSANAIPPAPQNNDGNSGGDDDIPF